MNCDRTEPTTKKTAKDRSGEMTFILKKEKIRGIGDFYDSDIFDMLSFYKVPRSCDCTCLSIGRVPIISAN